MGRKLIMVAIAFSAAISVGFLADGTERPSNTASADAVPGAPAMKLSAINTVETPGFDMSVYEFDLTTYPNKHCVFAIVGDRGGLSCFER